MRGPALTIAQENRIANLYLAGLSHRKVAAVIGCTHRAVAKSLKRHGVESRGYTSARHCVVCGEPVEKVISRGHYIGAKCRAHRLERKREIMQARRENATARRAQTAPFAR